MKWSQEAEKALEKIPFFVRKKVRKKAEEFTASKGKACVDVSDLGELKKKFLSREGMEKQIKGYEVVSCFGDSGCPNSAVSCACLSEDIRAVFEKEDILSFLKENVKGGLKFHHEFRVVLSDCPNACSRPQIADIGIIGAVRPRVVHNAPCTMCRACTALCAENAIVLDSDEERPVINRDKCLMCSKCIEVCPSASLDVDESGFRVLVGGRLGRHPRLGMELDGIFSHDQVLEIIKKCLKFYKTNSKDGQRFSHILSSADQIGLP
jgi:dissimilatory sulfite reductase (desulfoviridin) alpha/beta subunit